MPEPFDLELNHRFSTWHFLHLKFHSLLSLSTSTRARSASRASGVCTRYRIAGLKYPSSSSRKKLRGLMDPILVEDKVIVGTVVLKADNSCQVHFALMCINWVVGSCEAHCHALYHRHNRTLVTFTLILVSRYFLILPLPLGHESLQLSIVALRDSFGGHLDG